MSFLEVLAGAVAGGVLLGGTREVRREREVVYQPVESATDRIVREKIEGLEAKVKSLSEELARKDNALASARWFIHLVGQGLVYAPQHRAYLLDDLYLSRCPDFGSVRLSNAVKELVESEGVQGIKS